MPTCARVTSLGIYLYVALDLPVRPGLSDPGPFYDHYHYGPPGPKCSRPREGASVASRNLMQSRVQPDERSTITTCRQRVDAVELIRY